MNFTKTFDEILSSVDKLFKEIDMIPQNFYQGEPEWNEFYNKLEDMDRLGTLHSGLTKFVLDLDPNDNFVIKMPFAGHYYHHCVSDPDERFQDYPVNHCQRELEDYNDLKDTDIGFLLVPTYFVGKVGEMEVYIQPKVEPYSYENHSASRQSYQVAESLEYFECTADDEDSIAAFIEAFGEEEGQHILSMLDDYGIRDIHTGNFGYQDGKLVIFDYCGYHSQCC